MREEESLEDELSKEIARGVPYLVTVASLGRHSARRTWCRRLLASTDWLHFLADPACDQDASEVSGRWQKGSHRWQPHPTEQNAIEEDGQIVLPPRPLPPRCRSC